jgi:hypothetical protein
VAGQPHDVRAEFAPVAAARRDPVERLATALRASDGQVLAIDSGVAKASERRMDAERDAERATQERRELEERRGGWLPGRRRELDSAREREEDAVTKLREARRVEAELRHGTRRFVTRGEIEARSDADRTRIAERATERVLRAGYGRER